jgi:hypothetical protein
LRLPRRPERLVHPESKGGTHAGLFVFLAIAAAKPAAATTAATFLAAAIAASGSEVGRPSAAAARASGEHDSRRRERSKSKQAQEPTAFEHGTVHLFTSENGMATVSVDVGTGFGLRNRQHRGDVRFAWP